MVKLQLQTTVRNRSIVMRDLFLYILNLTTRKEFTCVIISQQQLVRKCCITLYTNLLVVYLFRFYLPIFLNLFLWPALWGSLDMRGTDSLISPMLGWWGLIDFLLPSYSSLTHSSLFGFIINYLYKGTQGKLKRIFKIAFLYTHQITTTFFFFFFQIYWSQGITLTDLPIAKERMTSECLRLYWLEFSW